jgi:translation initiation factor 2 alpha subunit (eIF-2alpha)
VLHPVHLFTLTGVPAIDRTAACAASAASLREQDLYKQIAWPLYKLYGHAFEAFKLMVADDGAALIKRLEEERGPLTVFTPEVRLVLNRAKVFFDPG